MIVRDSAPLVSQIIVGMGGTERNIGRIFSNWLGMNVYPRQTYFCPYKDTHLLESVFFSRAQSVYQNALVLISFVLLNYLGMAVNFSWNIYAYVILPGWCGNFFLYLVAAQIKVAFTSFDKIKYPCSCKLNRSSFYISIHLTHLHLTLHLKNSEFSKFRIF